MIVDTNALSAFADGSDEVRSALSAGDRIAVPVIVLGEFRYGVAQSRQKQVYELWLDTYLPDFQVLEISERTSLKYAAIRTELRRIGRPIPANDAWIAALCREYQLPLLSRDRHFDYVKDLRRVSW